jgi:hypothetical protein
MFYQLGILIIRHKRGGMIEKQYQTFWPRVGASFIDTAIFYPFDLIARLVIYTLHPYSLLYFGINSIHGLGLPIAF